MGDMDIINKKPFQCTMTDKIFNDFKINLASSIKYYQNAFQQQPIGELTKDMMLAKADELRGQIKKK